MAQWKTQGGKSETLSVIGRHSRVAIVLLLLVSGCRNPFSTREPEPPTGKQLPLLEPTSAENVLRNLEVCCEYMSINDYMNTLSQDFLFLPDPSDNERFPEVFCRSWDRQSEFEFCRRLFDKEITSLISFCSSVDSNATVIEETTESVHYRYDYYIILIYRQHTEAPQSVKGRAELYLRCDRQGNWTIFRWEDEKTDSHSWGELKGRF
ncbi:MAG: hypothetical protein DRQ02_00055 [Candidatus Latescibacterota bacterium]|nr:MAG: hypothetical protein DRQ02_00055 [Candidatus Latescibacterota bacterium]